MESILLPYQERWVLDRSPKKICEKSRRTGITWATAYEAVEVSAAADGSNFWYQTYAEDDAKEFIDDVGKWARGASLFFQPEEETLEGEEAEEYFLLPDGVRSVKITSVRFKSGHRVVALPHSPRKLRGKGGVYCLDEAAFHDDMKAARKAASAFRMWGGRIIIISTHNGVDNEFNQLIEDIKVGKEKFSHHRVTLTDAVAEGLYRRICLVLNEEWTPEKEEEWVQDLLSEDGADEEYLCIPSRSGGQYISTALVMECMSSDFPVVRWDVPDAFLFEEDREEACQAWCIANLDSLLKKLPKDKPHYIGEDFGRNADITSFAIGYEDQDLKLKVPFMVELRNMPYDQQEQVFFYITDKLPRFSFGALDGTGNGAALGEAALAHYGESLIESVKMNDPWYAANLPFLKSRFEDQEIVIPKDLDVRQDLAMFEKLNGVPKLPKIRVNAARQNAPRKEKRHGDAGVALACLVYAARHDAVSYGYEQTDRRGGDFASKGMLF